MSDDEITPAESRAAGPKKIHGEKTTRSLPTETDAGACTVPNMATTSLATVTFSPRRTEPKNETRSPPMEELSAGRDAAEEVDHVVTGFAVQAHVSEEDHDVALRLSPSAWTLQKKQTAS